jgi:Protein of unknown function (DUF2971)
MTRRSRDEFEESNRPPEILYKYITSKRAEPILRESRLYFASLLEFNDPFDCKAARVSFRAPVTVKEHFLRRLLKDREPLLPRHERNRRVRQTLAKSADEMFEKTYVRFLRNHLPETAMLCLSEKKDDILMWSHYSYGHTGLCLGFKVSPAVSDFTLPQSDSPGFFGNAMKVRYSDNRPVLDFFKIAANLEKRGPEGDEARRLFIYALYLAKANHWSYEQEWRLIIAFRGMACRGSYKFPPELLHEVTLGCQMATEQQDKVIKWMSERKTRPLVYKARTKQTEFGLEFDAL